MRKTILSGAASVLAFASNACVGADQPSNVALNALAIGALGPTDLAIGMLEARAFLSPHLLVTAAPTILSARGGATEQQFRAAATLLLDVGPIRLDDRNLWVFSDAGTTRYRNRLRLTAPIEVSGHTLRLQLLDEVFHEQGGRGWFRNLLGAGVGFDAGRSFSVDAYWMLQDERHRAPASMLVVILTAHLL